MSEWRDWKLDFELPRPSSSHEIDSPAKKAESPNNDLTEDDEDKKKKKKRSEKKSDSNLINEGAPMSEGYMGGRSTNDNCPLLDSIEKKCRGIDIMSGDSHQNLLEACGAHQLCYICVSSMPGLFAIDNIILYLF